MEKYDWLEDDYYHLLGVGSSTSPEEINKAFRHKAKEFHPDKHPIDSLEYKEAEEKFKLLLLAKETLLDPDKKFEYDEERLSIQQANLAYLATVQQITLQKPEAPPKKSFKDVLKEKMEEEEESPKYFYSEEENAYISYKYVNEVDQMTKEEKAVYLKKENAKKMYNMALQFASRGDLRRAMIYFRSAKYLDPGVRIPMNYYQNIDGI